MKTLKDQKIKKLLQILYKAKSYLYSLGGIVVKYNYVMERDWIITDEFIVVDQEKIRPPFNKIMFSK